jgi:DNA-binding response OmpR family regulator
MIRPPRTGSPDFFSGADEYITKPFRAREIEVIVERVRMRQLIGQLGQASAELPA